LQHESHHRRHWFSRFSSGSFIAEKTGRGQYFKRASGNTVETELIFRYHFGEESHHYLKKLNFIPGNITDASSLKKAMPGVKHVYHCAAVVSFRRKDLCGNAGNSMS
jgi:nucleoside-diphosphate-sugar epimerase